MATQVNIEFISEGFKEILTSDGVKSLVTEVTNNIQAKANANIGGESEGFSAQVRMGGYGGGRWIGHVTTTDGASIRAESEDKALTRAVK